jgi:hypothetical protein
MPDTSFPRWAQAAIHLLSLQGRRARLAAGEIAGLLAEQALLVPPLRHRRIESLLYFACHQNPPPQRAYDKAWHAQRQAMDLIVRALMEAGVTPIIFKGAEFLAEWYGGSGICFIYDIDILVHRQEIGLVKQVLFTHGYRQSVFDPKEGRLVDVDVQEIAKMEATQCELVGFVRLEEVACDSAEQEFLREWNHAPFFVVGDKAYVLLQFDVHHQVTVDVETEQFFRRAKPSATGRGLTMCAADQIWFTTCKYYTEVATRGKESLRDFAYLLPCLNQPAIDWDVIVGSVQHYGLRPALYYYLRIMDELSGGVVPARVLEELQPTKGSRGLDWGWQLSKLCDAIDPDPLQGIPGLERGK